MAQTSVRIVTFKSIIASQAFRVGYEDAKNGKGFNESYNDYHEKAQWNYERGRQFFVATRGVIPPYVDQKLGRPAVAKDAIRNFAWHYSRGNIL